MLKYSRLKRRSNAYQWEVLDTVMKSQKRSENATLVHEKNQFKVKLAVNVLHLTYIYS